MINGHDDKAKESIEKTEKEAKKVPIKNSFMLPGLGEQPKVCRQCPSVANFHTKHTTCRVQIETLEIISYFQLRSKPKVPLPNKSSPIVATESVSTNESITSSPTTPAWMVEAKLKRQSRTPVEDTADIRRVNKINM